MAYDLEHLESFDDYRAGPIQPDEALFLFSLVRVVRPRVIVELGFYEGHSATNFLKSMPDDCNLYSFDCSAEAENFSKRINDPRFKFIRKFQEEFCTADIDNNSIDILFIDA